MDYLNLSRAIANGHAAETIPPWSANVLRAIIEGRRTLRAAVHPLGFTCLPVIREGRYGVCVHAWLPGQQVARPTTSAVHAHSWDLVSYVLIGRLRNELPDVTGAQPGAVGAWQVLEVRSRGDTDVIVPTRRLVHCQAGESALHVQDDVYTVPTRHLSQLHRGQRRTDGDHRAGQRQFRRRGSVSRQSRHPDAPRSQKAARPGGNRGTRAHDHRPVLEAQVTPTLPTTAHQVAVATAEAAGRLLRRRLLWGAPGDPTASRSGPRAAPAT